MNGRPQTFNRNEIVTILAFIVYGINLLISHREILDDYRLILFVLAICHHKLLILLIPLFLRSDLVVLNFLYSHRWYFPLIITLF